MSWEDLKKQAQKQFQNSDRAKSYVVDYRRIPVEIASLYELGAIRPKELLSLPELTESQKGGIGSLNDTEWLVAFVEGLDQKPLAIELRSTGTGARDFYKIYLPYSKIHPVIFGVSQALSLIFKKGWVAVVEGIFDALSFASITEFPVISILTKTPNFKQSKWLIRWARKISLFLDADEEGQAAARAWVASRLWSACNVVDSRWYECPSIRIGEIGDLNELLQQQGTVSLRSSLEYRLSR